LISVIKTVPVCQNWPVEPVWRQIRADRWHRIVFGRSKWKKIKDKENVFHFHPGGTELFLAEVNGKKLKIKRMSFIFTLKLKFLTLIVSGCLRVVPTSLDFIWRK
jgi:hypothetical protein